MISMVALVLGFLLDICLGDPHWLPHPVRWMGRLITGGEQWIRRLLPTSKEAELLGGGLLVVLVVGTSFAAPWLLLRLAEQVHGGARLVLETLMCYQILATKALQTESMAVYEALMADDLPEARQRVSMIVGRDTAHLDREGVTKAAVETVAENTSDGVIAPCLFLVLGGAPWGFLYKAVNTLDSMIGYQNARYRYFGRIAAKLDDIFNYIPARLSAGMMLMTAALYRWDFRGGWRIYRRDRYQHASPNSAQTEAVCAGVLGIRLAGDASYFGQLHHKPTIGDPSRAVTPADIKRANQLLYGTAVLTLVVLLGLKGLFLGVF